MTFQQSTSTISPNLLLNFNPYDILQPEKTNPGPQVEKLIDLDDVILNTEATGSINDQKSNYELIDLIQNLYVTPKDIKVNNAATSAPATSNNDIFDTNIDYKDFFDKHESNEKIDWVNIDANTRTVISNKNDIGSKANDENDRVDIRAKTDSNVVNNFDDIVSKPKVLIAKLDLNDTRTKISNMNKEKSQNSIETDPQDLIDEVLTEKTMEKIILNKINESKMKITKNIENTIETQLKKKPKLKILSTPNIIFDTPNQSTKSTQTILNTEPSTSKLNNYLTKDTNTDKNKHNNAKIDNQIDNTTNLNLTDTKKENNLKTDNTLKYQVIPHIKNPKIFKKKCITKPENETNMYTKGVDFDDITEELPKIMSRILDRQAYLEERAINNKQKRFINKEIDVSPKNIDDLKKLKNEHEKIFYILNQEVGGPHVLMADCNKERLRDYEQSKRFQNFVNGKK